jgi:hypothetical protein
MSGKLVKGGKNRGRGVNRDVIQVKFRLFFRDDVTKNPGPGHIPNPGFQREDFS